MRWHKSEHRPGSKSVRCSVQSELDADSVGNTICKRGKDMKATAIVISSQSRSKMQEFLLGSITNYCTHHCQQPVLVVQ